MPTTNNNEEMEDKQVIEEHLLDNEDSSDEDESDSDSGSSSDSGSDSDSDSDESDSDSDGSDSDDDSDDSDSGSDSEDDGKKKKDDKKEEEDDSGPNAIYKIRQISSKLSWLLDDLHKTFKPKSVPKINPKDVFPYPYISIPQSPSTKHYQYNHNVMRIQQPPIGSPVRHRHTVDRGAGDNYIFPSYAAPPSQDEIKELYKNYNDNEREKIAQNQEKERERKSIFARKQNTARQSGSFSDKFISASNFVRNQANVKRKLFTSNAKKNDIVEDISMPHTFDELYKHYDEQQRLIHHKQNKLNKMRNRIDWFKKNKDDTNYRISEKKPLMQSKLSDNDKNDPLVATKSMSQLKKTENNLLNKAAQILLRNTNKAKSSSNLYDAVTVHSPDSLQEKIMHIASDEEEENRMPTFV